MDAYARIEAKTGFRVPELYRRMRADGVLDFPPRVILGECQPALTVALDFQWITLDKMVAWDPPDYWAPEHVFVPFGESHAGDDYAWYPAWADGADVPVVMAWRDDNRCVVEAPHLEGFMYRKLLETMTYYSAFYSAYEIRTGTTWEEHRAAVRKDLDLLRPYLRASWMADLDELYARKPVEWRQQMPYGEEKYLTQLDERELKERIARELPYARLDTWFRHMKPGSFGS